MHNKGFTNRRQKQKKRAADTPKGIQYERRVMTLGIPHAFSDVYCMLVGLAWVGEIIGFSSNPGPIEINGLRREGKHDNRL